MKAILMLDEMPKTCDECPFSHWLDRCGDDYCTAIHDTVRLIGEKYYSDRAEWCPLKPMPQKMTPVTLHQCIEDEYLYQKGWNDCLEEIENGYE